MKRNFLIAVGAILGAALVTGCSWKLPEKISLKGTGASYNFTVAKIQKSLNEYIGVDTIQAQLPAESSMRVFDYNPEGLETSQEFLVKVPLMTVPIDMSSYIQELTMDALSIKQEVEIPSVSFDQSVNLNVKELADGLNGMVKFGGPLINASMSITGIPEDNESFEYFEYSSGCMDIYLEEIEDTTASVELSSGGLTSNADFVKLATPVVKEFLSYSVTLNYKASINLAGKRVSMNGMQLSFTGAKLTSYEGVKLFYGEVSEDSVIQKAVGVNYSIKDMALTKQSSDISFDGLSEAEIGKGTLLAKLQIPSEWTGVNLNCTYDLSLAGEKWVEGGKVNWTQEITNKKLKSGTLEFAPTINIDVENGTIDFEKLITLGVQLRVNSVNYVEVDSTKYDFANMVKIDPITMPDEVSQYVTDIWLDESEFKVTTINTFPEGNDISVKLKSEYLALDDGFDIPAGGVEKTSTMKTNAFDGYKATKNAKLDFDGTVNLAKNEETGNYRLVNIEPGKKYELSISVVPELKWKKMKIDVSKINTSETPIASPEGGMDTGLNFGELLKGLDEKTSGLLNQISIDKLPVFIYAQNPGIDALNHLAVKGNVSLTNGSKTVEVLKENQALELKTESLKLVTDEKGVVTNRIKAEDASASADLAPLFDTSATESIKVDYNLNITGAGTEPMEIAYDDLFGDGESEPKNLEVVAFVEIPLELTVKEGGATINVNDFIKNSAASEPAEGESAPESSSGDDSAVPDEWKDDLLSRKGPVETKDYEKAFDIIDSMSVTLTSFEFPFVDSDGNVRELKLKYDLFPGTEASDPQEFEFNKATIKLSAEQIKTVLQKPFNPLIEIVIPEGPLCLSRAMNLVTKVDFNVSTTEEPVVIWSKDQLIEMVTNN